MEYQQKVEGLPYYVRAVSHKVFREQVLAAPDPEVGERLLTVLSVYDENNEGLAFATADDLDDAPLPLVLKLKEAALAINNLDEEDPEGN